MNKKLVWALISIVIAAILIFSGIKIYYKVNQKEWLAIAGKATSQGMEFQNKAKIKEAIVEYEKALVYYGRTVEDDNQLYIVLFNNLAGAYGADKQYEKAKNYYEKALGLYKKHNGERPSAVFASFYNNMGGVYLEEKKYRLAGANLLKSLEILKSLPKKSRDDFARMAASLTNLGEIYRDNADFSNAIKYFGQALQIDTQNMGEESIVTAVDYNNLGLAYMNNKEYKKSLKNYKSALKIVKKLNPKDLNVKVLESNIEYLNKKIAEGKK